MVPVKVKLVKEPPIMDIVVELIAERLINVIILKFKESRSFLIRQVHSTN
jgi:hypothetical protein